MNKLKGAGRGVVPSSTESTKVDKEQAKQRAEALIERIILREQRERDNNALLRQQGDAERQRLIATGVIRPASK